MHDRLTRRDALAAGLTAAALATLGARRAAASTTHAGAVAPPDGPVAVASANGLATVELACARMRAGTDPALAAVEGVGIVEADPNDDSVGLGGLPDERGVVTLDAAVMHGPTHKAGAVAAIEDTLHPAAVALKVLQTTDHVLLVGEGARRFARLHGFPHHDLLTDRAREAWLRWKRRGNPGDDWLDPDQTDWNEAGDRAVPHTTGTIHCSCVDDAGDLACCTTTSGLSWKIHGRVGDSPLVGCGLFCDNDVGSAGCTGRGEAAILSVAASSTVEAMRRGLSPVEAALEVLATVERRSRRQKRHVGADGRLNFDLKIYALRKDGSRGAASVRPNARFAVCDREGARLEDAASLY